MKVLLSALPESLEETTAQEETALHLAVKNNWFDAVVVLLEHLKQHKKEQVINRKDNKGNTISHLTVAAEKFEAGGLTSSFVGHAMDGEVVDVRASNEVA
ncbi:hypothetical protein NL676_009350 [Syzygium grande]|nr:hypothetical protein NL676_009350 [Syzygium grande]